MDKGKVKMRVKIGSFSVPLNVEFDEQDHVREAERLVASLYDNWRRMFANKSEPELLAMMTYQYASHYLKLQEDREKIGAELLDFEKEVDDIILKQ